MESTGFNLQSNAAVPPKRLFLAGPRGFCAGVDRAVSTVELALRLSGPPVYVRHQIVHNQPVVDRLTAAGAVFVDELSEVPPGAIVVFSAHGVSPDVRRSAGERDLRVIDATCPLVTKVHVEAHAYAKRGLSVLLIGHAGHDEVVGVMGELPGGIQLIASVEDARLVEVADPERVGVLMQTTLSTDDSREILAVLRERFPSLVLPLVDDICYATQNRQRAVRAIAARAALVIVLGSANSSNAQRLCEVARNGGAAACLVDEIGSLDTALLTATQIAGLTASASTPEWIVQQAISQLASYGFGEIEEVVVAEETVSFAPPRLAQPSYVPLQAIRSALP